MNSTRGIITPNLDKLADAGVVLKNYYVQPICSPTRSALMTGRYTIRLGTQASVIYWDTPWGIPINETFLSQNLKGAGYTTAMFGKSRESATRGSLRWRALWRACLGSAVRQSDACCVWPRQHHPRVHAHGDLAVARA